MMKSRTGERNLGERRGFLYSIFFPSRIFSSVYELSWNGTVLVQSSILTTLLAHFYLHSRHMWSTHPVLERSAQRCQRFMGCTSICKGAASIWTGPQLPGVCYMLGPQIVLKWVGPDLSIQIPERQTDLINYPI